MKEDIFFDERTGEMRFAPAPRRSPPPKPASHPAQAAKRPKAKRAEIEPKVEPSPPLMVPASHKEVLTHLLGTARRMCRHLRDERSAQGMPSQRERGERVVALIERLHRGDVVMVDEAIETESMASTLFLASTRDNPDTGQTEYHGLSWHAAEVMDWALRCAIGRQAAKGFVAACQRFTAFVKEP